VQGARDYLTVSVYVENRTPGNGSFEVFDLIIRGDKCADEETSADGSEIEGEEQSREGKGSHGGGEGRGGGGGVGDRSPVEVRRIYACEWMQGRREWCSAIWRGGSTMGPHAAHARRSNLAALG